MDSRAHRLAERSVDLLMALDQTHALEARAYHQRLKMIASAGSVAYLDLRARQALLNKFLYFAWIHHVEILTGPNGQFYSRNQTASTTVAIP